MGTLRSRKSTRVASEGWLPKTCPRNVSSLPTACSTLSSTSSSCVSSPRMATPVSRFARPRLATRSSSVPHHPERARREGPPHSRAHRRRAEALRLPPWVGRALRCEGAQPRPLLRRTGRVPPLQAPRRPCCAPCVLRCTPLHHGERCPRVRGDRLWKAQGTARQEHEIRGRLHDQGR